MFSRFQRARAQVDVDLTPVMNLFVTLIPFMLLGAAFYHVGVIPISFPSQTDQQSDVATQVDSVTVDMLVTSESITISAANPSIPEEELEKLSLTLVREASGFDMDMLSRALHLIKQRYPKSDTVIVLPDDEVSYADVIQVLDAARELVTNKGQLDEARIPLFPVVVLSRKV